MKFEVGQIWIARDGGKWRILATDGSFGYPVIAVKAGEWVGTFTVGGCFDDAVNQHKNDLIREDREPARIWCNDCGDSNDGSAWSIHTTEEDARKNVDSDVLRIAVPFIEVVEGDGK